MCYQGKCLMCIPVEHGCLVLAILSSIFTGFCLLVSVVGVILTAAGVIKWTNEVREHRYDSWANTLTHQDIEAATIIGGIAIGIPIFIVLVASLIAFIFSVLLFNGICKRRPGQVKAYFIYGVIITVVAVLAAVGYLITNYPNPAPGIYTLIASVFYSLFLVLVHQTYFKLLEGAVFKDHIRLVES